MKTFREFLEQRDPELYEEGWKDWAKKAALGASIATGIGGVGMIAKQGVDNVNNIHRQAQEINPQFQVEKSSSGFVYHVADYQNYDPQVLKTWIKMHTLETVKNKSVRQVQVFEMEPGTYRVSFGMDPATLQP